MTRALGTTALLCALAAQAGCGGDGYGGGGDSSYTPPVPPPSSRWQSLASLSEPRQEHGVAALNGEIYVVGGFSGQQTVLNTVEAFNPATNTWRSVASLPSPLHHVNVAVARGHLFVVGALEGRPADATGVTLEYDPGTNMWQVRASMPAGSERGASAVAAIGDLIYVAGGLRGASVNDFSVYDAASNQWQNLQNMPTARDHLVGAAYNGRFYAIAGRNAGGLRGDVEIYDPSAPGWSMGRPIPTPRGGCGGAMLGGRIYVFGGEGNAAVSSGVFDTNEAYDPLANTWATLEVMRTPRHGIGAAPVGSVIYVPGGATRQGFGATSDNDSFTP
jgi:N-acetylneuraminic acid mutarotase